MSYSRINKPKFFIDAGLLASTKGHASFDNTQYKRLYNLNPWGFSEIDLSGGTTNIGINFTPEGTNSSEDKFYASAFMHSLNYISIMGFEIPDADPTDNINYIQDDLNITIKGIDGSGTTNVNYASDVNVDQSYGIMSANSDTIFPESNFCLIDFDRIWNATSRYYSLGLDLNSVSGEDACLVGSVSVGWSYSPQISPDLGLTVGYKKSDHKKFKTLSGNTISKYTTTGKKGWMRGKGMMPFQRSSSGRFVGSGVKSMTTMDLKKTFSMSFSFIADTKLFPEHINDTQSWKQNAPFLLNNGSSTTNDNDAKFDGISDDFISKVWWGTMGGALPFIFMPNSDEEEFYIVRFVDDSINFEQVAHGTYNVSFTLEEAW